ncbi:hypothetical protein G3T14_13250 [Methylobacterium sp. BTF04]|uniref:hypothetical protein n=1 Tax=Methylobacterium sp. BTF04 TaxID=2708300 RepID=UPI0013D22878|nr:hypothetical protein [Methylobacterium sp. BTF04]NEU13099.1 hypothetical protein [Methylobacterium sp. BTF04]
MSITVPITVPITALGVIRATELVQTTRNALAERHDHTTRTVSVEVGQGAPTLSHNSNEDEPPRQPRVVDLQV